MRTADIDTTGSVWHYLPASHKTEHHGHARVVEFGPRAQAVIRPFLKPDLEASAAAVWLALCDLSAARRSSVVTPTRAQVSSMTGLRLRTVSNSLTTLEKAGWIDRAHIPVTNEGKRTATLLRIVLLRKGRSTTEG